MGTYLCSITTTDMNYFWHLGT